MHLLSHRYRGVFEVICTIGHGTFYSSAGIRELVSESMHISRCRNFPRLDPSAIFGADEQVRLQLPFALNEIGTYLIEEVLS